MLMVTSKCRKLINPQKCAMEVFYVLCKSKPIQYVKLNPYPLRRNDRDRRCRVEARRLEHSLIVSGRGFESFRYDGLLIIACVTELTSFGEI